MQIIEHIDAEFFTNQFRELQSCNRLGTEGQKRKELGS
jgi:hypothetical protein